MDIFSLSEDGSLPKRDDTEGHYRYAINEILNGRYEILQPLGSGTFGKVVKALDIVTNMHVAVKIIRNIPKYRDAAKLEYLVLCSLRLNDPNQERHCVPILDCFDHYHHICFVFPLYGLSLFDFMGANRFKPFKLSHVKHFTWQVLQSVAYMHGLGFVHTDLKPENVLLECSDYQVVQVNHGSIKIPLDSRVKLCDFGSAAKIHSASNLPTTIVSTRHYRAPEVILGHGWSFPCDMWSLGCVIVELVTGSALFHTHDNAEHLAMMERVLGPIPESLIRKTGPELSVYFTEDRRLNWPSIAPNPESIKRVNSMQPLETILAGAPPQLLSLVRSLLTYEVDKRIPADACIAHPFYAELAMNCPRNPICMWSSSCPIPVTMTLPMHSHAVFQAMPPLPMYAIPRSSLCGPAAADYGAMDQLQARMQYAQQDTMNMAGPVPLFSPDRGRRRSNNGLPTSGDMRGGPVPVPSNQQVFAIGAPGMNVPGGFGNTKRRVLSMQGEPTGRGMANLPAPLHATSVK